MQIPVLYIEKRTLPQSLQNFAFWFTDEPQALQNITSSRQGTLHKKWRFPSEQCSTVTLRTISNANNNRWPTADQLVFFVLPWVNFVLPWVNFVLPWVNFILPWINGVLPWVNFVLPSHNIVLPWVQFIVPWLFVLPWQLWATVNENVQRHRA